MKKILYDIYKMGKVLAGESNLFAPETPKNITNVISLCFEINEESIQYKGVAVTDYSLDIAEKYLLRKAGSNGANYGPTAQLTEIDKTLNKKIIAWFKDAKIEESDNSYKKYLEDIYNFLIENKENIEKEINNNMPKGKGINNLLTVNINDKFPIDVKYIYKIYSDKLKNKLVGSDNHVGTCCLCGEDNVSLIPKVDVFKFYTLDKPGFISGGFSERNVWRNCPVCISCEPILREGKKFMLDNLRFDFYGLSYYLIPSTTSGMITNEILLSRLHDIKDKNFSFEKDKINLIHTLSDDIFDVLAEENDINSYRILFFKKDNSAERIILDIKDIFPSRFKALYSAKAKIEKVYKNAFNDINSKEDMYFDFYYFRESLRKTDNKRRTNDLDSEFLILARAIFLKEKVSDKMLISHYMRNIRNTFSEDGAEIKFSKAVLRAFAGLSYLKEIGCICCKEESFMNEKLHIALEPYKLGLDTDVKKSLLLTGALVKKTMNIQANKLNGATPFTNKLKEFKMRQSDINAIIKEVVNKMIQYDSYSKDSKILVEEVFELMLRSPADWKMLIDDINFYIVGGMTLSKKIYDSLKEED